MIKLAQHVERGELNFFFYPGVENNTSMQMQILQQCKRKEKKKKQLLQAACHEIILTGITPSAGQMATFY